MIQSAEKPDVPQTFGDGFRLINKDEAEFNESDGPKVSDDAFLGGRLRLLQPESGYRAGIDAILLASCVAASKVNNNPAQLLDVGAGVGAIGLSVARRCESLDVTLVERESVLSELSAINAKRNGLASRTTCLTCDVTANAAHHESAGLVPESYDWVVANPPYFDTLKSTKSSKALKASSHAMATDGLELWAKFMVRMAKPKGNVLIIHKADVLYDVLRVLNGRFGAALVLPVSSFSGDPARCVIIQATKGRRGGGLTLLAPLVVHAEGGEFTDQAEAILRHGEGFDLTSRLG